MVDAEEITSAMIDAAYNERMFQRKCSCGAWEFNSANIRGIYAAMRFVQLNGREPESWERAKFSE